MSQYSKSENKSLSFLSFKWRQHESADFTMQDYRLVLSRVMTGWRLPNWKQLVASGVQATTPFTGMKQSCKQHKADAFCITDYGWGPLPKAPHFVTLSEHVTGNRVYPFNALAGSKPDSSRADQQALSRLYAALRQQRTQMRAGITAGEFGESVRGLGETASSLARMFGAHLRQQQKLVRKYIGSFVIGPDGSPLRDNKAVRALKRDPTRWQRIHQELRDGWLNFSLGVRPVVADVKDLAETIARWNLDFEVNHSMIRGYGKQSNSLGNMSGPYSDPPFDAVYSQKDWTEVEVIYRAKLHPDWDAAPIGSAHRLYQLLGAYDLENWIPTIWNLLPKSFVIDYVTNVADVVTAMVTDTSRVAWVCKTTRWTTYRDYRVHVPYKRTYLGIVGGTGSIHPLLHSFRSQSGTLGGYTLATAFVERVGQAGFALPELTFNFPSAEGLAIPNLLALFFGGKPTRDFKFG